MKQSRTQKKFVFSRREPDIPSELKPDTDATLFQSRDIFISDRLVEESRAENLKAGTLRIASSVFSKVVLANSSFGAITCRDVRFTGCDFANVETHGLTLIRVEFINFHANLYVE